MSMCHKSPSTPSVLPRIPRITFVILLLSEVLGEFSTPCNWEIGFVSSSFFFVRAVRAGEAKLRGRMETVVLIAGSPRCKYPLGWASWAILKYQIWGGEGVYSSIFTDNGGLKGSTGPFLPTIKKTGKANSSQVIVCVTVDD